MKPVAKNEAETTPELQRSKTETAVSAESFDPELSVERTVSGHSVRLEGGIWRQEDGAELLDRRGRPFDPSIHLTLADGTPDLVKSEPVLKRRSGRAGARAERELEARTVRTALEGDDSRRDERCATGDMFEIQADALVETICGMAVSCLGVRGRATPDERLAMKRAFGAYLRALGVSNLPPWSGPISAMEPFVTRVTRIYRPEFSEGRNHPE